MDISFESYGVSVSDDSVSIFLGGRRHAVLKAASAFDSVDARDVDAEVSGPVVTRRAEAVELVWHARSPVWPAKTYRWRFEPDLCWYQMTVEGRQTVDHLRFFDGAAPSFYGWSFFDFSQFANPDCALLDQRCYKSMQYGCIDASAGRMSEVARDGHADCHWIFCPPPLAYSLGFSSGPWLGAGLAPDRGQYGFTRFEYVPGPNSFCFRLTYDGMTRIDGEWASPKFIFCPAADEYEALARCCDTVRAWGLVDENKHPRADWWSRNILCGWGEQNVNSIRRGGVPSNSLATQEMYDRFLGIIDAKRLRIGTIVIDDKWQKTYGTNEVDTAKWPDMRGWIDARHAEGRRVLLWFGAWCPEGLPPEECVRDKDGGAPCIDPTSPAYQDRIGEMLHTMLSPYAGCCNADGIKYDWINGEPIGRGYRLHGNTWGIELVKLLSKQVYDAAKAAKPDALVITHTANPYFAECADMIRLNDIFVGCREVASMMRHRQKIARIAVPHALIDCDNSSAPDHTEWLEYTRIQPELGVPSLYFLTGFDGTLEEITDEDWEALAPIWRRTD